MRVDISKVDRRMDGNRIDYYAPLLVTVYNRVEHFKKCIESLKANLGAEKTILYVAIDAPSRDCDKRANEEILDYVKRIDGFFDVILIAREKNVGAVNNYFMALDQVFETNSRLIFTEDDNVFSKYFLDYVNEGLELYENDPSIFGICGYSRPGLGIGEQSEDLFLSRDCPAWGHGLWRAKFRQVDYQTKDFFKKFRNPLNILSFQRQWGDHFFWSLTRAKRQGVVICDAAVGFHKYKSNMFSILPIKSLVRNIGQDGSGIHSGVNSQLQNQEIWSVSRKIEFPAMLSYPNAIDEARANLLKIPFLGNVKCLFQFYVELFKRFIK